MFIAGQIALNPSTMTVLQGSSDSSLSDVFYAQLTLACRHVSRVLQTLNSSLHRVLCCTVFVNLSAMNKEDVWSDWQKVQSVVQKLIENKFESQKSESDGGNDEYSDEQSVDSAVVVSAVMVLMVC